MNPTDGSLRKRYFGADQPVEIFDYDADNNIIYSGWAQWGSATTDEAWLIFKYSYSGGNLTKKEATRGGPTRIWANRVTLTYG